MLENTVVIGIGNDHRGDDAFGLLTVRNIKKIISNKVCCYEHSSDATGLISLWQKEKVVFLIDAIYSKDPCGTIYCLDLKKEILPNEWFYSTHSFNIAQVIELAQILDQMPKKILLYGVVGKNFEIGEKISPKVFQAIETLTTEIIKDINSF
ncbi:MAG: hydrogenase maturation protease [Acidobacteria bacterium]|nr:hydrogenase maturation protease [Acidobacteriota bacterium]